MKKYLFLTSRLTIVFYGLMIANLSQAQDDFFSGYIVKNSGDTLRGQIRFYGQLEAQNGCVFVAFDSRAMETYRPSDLLSYGITNRGHYVSKRITVNSVAIKQVFIKQSLNGEVSLYRYFNRDDYRLFIDKKGADDFVELKRDKHYKGVLNSMIGNCIEVKKDIARVPYNFSKIRELIYSYNLCINPDFKLEENIAMSDVESKKIKGPKKTSLSVTAGLVIDNLELSSDDPDFVYLSHVDVETQLLPKAELLFRSYFRGTPDKLALSVGASYFFRKYVGDSEQLLPPNITERNNILIQFHSVNVPVHLEYYFSENTLKPYLKVGGEYRFLSSHSNSRVMENEQNNEIFIDEGEAFDLASTELALSFGAGLSYQLSNSKALGVELRYTNGSGVDQDGFSSTSQVQLLVSLSFEKIK